MNKLLSDKVIAGAKKIPIFVWYIFYAVSALFASLEVTITAGSEYIRILTESFPGFINFTRTLWLFYPLSALFEVLLFELFAFILYSIFASRAFPSISRVEFVFRYRFLRILCNVVLGIVGIIYFFVSDDVMNLISTIMNAAVVGTVTVLFIFYICNKYVSDAMRKRGYKFILQLYLGISLAVALISVIRDFVTDVRLIVLMASVGGLIVYGALAGVAYYLSKKLVSSGGDGDGGIKIQIVESQDNVFGDFDM